MLIDTHMQLPDPTQAVKPTERRKYDIDMQATMQKVAGWLDK
jgi:hypothetical protein